MKLFSNTYRIESSAKKKASSLHYWYSTALVIWTIFAFPPRFQREISPRITVIHGVSRCFAVMSRWRFFGPFAFIYQFYPWLTITAIHRDFSDSIKINFPCIFCILYIYLCLFVLIIYSIRCTITFFLFQNQ